MLATALTNQRVGSSVDADPSPTPVVCVCVCESIWAPSPDSDWRHPADSDQRGVADLGGQAIDDGGTLDYVHQKEQQLSRMRICSPPKVSTAIESVGDFSGCMDRRGRTAAGDQVVCQPRRRWSPTKRGDRGRYAWKLEVPIRILPGASSVSLPRTISRKS